jgi:hypothetical protein
VKRLDFVVEVAGGMVFILAAYFTNPSVTVVVWGLIYKYQQWRQRNG